MTVGAGVEPIMEQEMGVRGLGPSTGMGVRWRWGMAMRFLMEDRGI